MAENGDKIARKCEEIQFSLAFSGIKHKARGKLFFYSFTFTVEFTVENIGRASTVLNFNLLWVVSWSTVNSRLHSTLCLIYEVW